MQHCTRSPLTRVSTSGLILQNPLEDRQIVRDIHHGSVTLGRPGHRQRSPVTGPESHALSAADRRALHSSHAARPGATELRAPRPACRLTLKTAAAAAAAATGGGGSVNSVLPVRGRDGGRRRAGGHSHNH